MSSEATATQQADIRARSTMPQQPAVSHPAGVQRGTTEAPNNPPASVVPGARNAPPTAAPPRTSAPPQAHGDTGSTEGRCNEYVLGRILGNGSFGVVIEAHNILSGRTVAIKKVLQDPRYKNRELDVMRILRHPNVVELQDFYYSETTARGGERSEGEKYLHVVMEYLPDTCYRVVRSYVRSSAQRVPMILVKCYLYQMCRALGYLHSRGICHRDIKPQNLMVDQKRHVLKLCDFGSAKKLIPGEQSVAYICSRYYRAPELMLGATEYTTSIDTWSIGCVFGEMLLGRPLFAGETSVDQLVKIIQTMGTPTRQQMEAMNPNYTEFRFPDVRARQPARTFGTHVPPEALDLIQKLLRYEPEQRIKPYNALCHEFFDELRSPNCQLPGAVPIPELFNLTPEELQEMSPEAQAKAKQSMPQIVQVVEPTGGLGIGGVATASTTPGGPAQRA